MESLRNRLIATSFALAFGMVGWSFAEHMGWGPWVGLALFALNSACAIPMLGAIVAPEDPR